MSENPKVLPYDLLIGMAVLSLSTGNKLGQVADIFVDPINGRLSALDLVRADRRFELPYDRIHSVGQDAIMAATDESAIPVDRAVSESRPRISEDLRNTKVITEAGNLLGYIANIYLTTSTPPEVVYELRESIFDKILGRQLFIRASGVYAFSDDFERLIVPNETVSGGSNDISELVNQPISIRSFDPETPSARSFEPDNTFVTPKEDDTTVLPLNEPEDETVIRIRDEDDTFVRNPGVS